MELSDLVLTGRDVVRRSGRRRGALLWLTAVLGLALGCAPILHAQSSSDPYAPPGVQGDNSGTGSSGNNNNTGTSQSGGSQSTAPIASFNPTIVPTYSAHNLGDYSDSAQKAAAAARASAPGAASGRAMPPLLSEFEKYVSERAGRPLPRFGSTLLLNGAQGFAVSPTATVPPDYTLNPGDELLIGVTGSIEVDLQLTVDPEGRIFIPRVGAVSVAGVRYGDLAAALKHRFNEQYKKVNVSVVIGHLHGLTVYVTGFAVSPGAYTISSLSTMVDAVIAAGGPAGGGSFRSVQLRRGGQLVATLDLYDLLLSGDKSHDVSLQNQDVLNIEPVGPELAMTGSVNQEAIYEAKPGETLGDIIRYAGGLNSLADESRLLVARLADLDKNGSEELTLAAAKAFPAERGDIVRVLSLANIARPLERQAILATIEGEVDHPGRYYLRPGSTVGDLLSQAGGLTAGAFVYGTDVSRDSLRQQQQVSFDRAIADLQLDAAASPLSDIRTIADHGAGAGARAQAALAIIDRLKAQKPDGRLVLALGPDATALPPNLTLENNDRIYVPHRPTTVGVFGAVYQTGSFLYTPGTRISAYLRLSGGPKRIAERGDMFVVRANGSVLSARQTHDLANQPALPGDVIFVPVRTTGGAFEKFLLLAQVISQFAITGLTLAALGS
jgi:polysaccharide export outer membrane protein